MKAKGKHLKRADPTAVPQHSRSGGILTDDKFFDVLIRIANELLDINFDADLHIQNLRCGRFRCTRLSGADTAVGSNTQAQDATLFRAMI